MRAKRISRDEQARLIMECRGSGLSDYQWCEANGILPGTFYNQISRLRKAGYTIPDPASRSVVPVMQEVVKLPVVNNGNPVIAAGFEEQNAGRLSSHSNQAAVEIELGRTVIRLLTARMPGRCRLSCSLWEVPPMLGDISIADSIYIITGYTDMRKSIDGLCAIVADQMKAVPDRNAIYLFCGKRCDRIKVLLREPDGYVLLYKRLDVIQGRFRQPRNSAEVKPITWQQFDWLMSGLDIEQPKALKTA